MEGSARWYLKIRARLYEVSRSPFKFFSGILACLHCVSVLTYWACVTLRQHLGPRDDENEFH